MALPDLTIDILDGALGIVQAGSALAHVKAGVCVGGTPNTLYSFGNGDALQKSLQLGALVEAGADFFMTASQCYFLVVNPSQFGFAGPVTLTGTGSGTVAVSFAPHKQVILKITTGGALGTMKFTYQVGGGAISQPQSTTAGASQTFLVPGTYCVVTFADGAFVLNSTYTIATDGTVTIGGGGINNVTQQSSPLDAWKAKVSITIAGALGTAAFTWSLDNGTTPSAQVVTTGGGKYAIPNSGIVLTFAGAFVALDVYAFDTTGPGFTNTDLNNAMATLSTTYAATEFGTLHVVGYGSSAAAAASQASAVDTQMTTLQNLFKYARAVIECPTVGTLITSGSSAIPDTADTDAVIIAAFQAFSSTRVCVAAGDCALTSQVSGRLYRRNAAWPATRRLGNINPGRDIAEIGLGALTAVRALFRDETATPGLDAQRFITLRTVQGLAGYYLTNAKTMAAPTSDYSRLANARVMDVACSTVRKGALKYINAAVRVNASNGTIVEKDAKAIEADLRGQLYVALIETVPPNASDVSVVVDRAANILSSATLPVAVRITPLGYMTFITVSIGFLNPALLQA